jgi:hypothetical protein
VIDERVYRPLLDLPPVAVFGTVLAVVLVVGVGLVVLLSSDDHQLHDPVHALQQLDLLYLDEPAPAYDRLGFERGRPALLVVCRACDAPPVRGEVVVTDDIAIASAYALATRSGRVGPGYAVIDARGHVRYRTFDPRPALHAREIQVLLDAVA